MRAPLSSREPEEVLDDKERHMDTHRIHRAISDDGTEIAGRVHGQGPSLVFVHGALDDGELDWGTLVPFLSERFTCYIMSTRNRGLSSNNVDLSPKRLVQDVTAFVASVGEPVGLVGLSGGGMLALGAAARTATVSAVAVYEPVVLEVIDEETFAGLRGTLERMSEAAAEGRLADAARTFLEPVVNDEELAALTASADYFESAGRYVPVDLREIQQATESQGPGPTDPSELARITVPVLLLHGSRSALRTWFTDGVRHVAHHVADPHVREITGAGHLGPSVQPEPVARELIRFFASRYSEA
jgi:pimeloyl-ACP methyl ester carboxylesterase